MADATPDEGTMPLASEDGTVSYRGGLLHVLHGTRVEDFRIFDGHVSDIPLLSHLLFSVIILFFAFFTRKTWSNFLFYSGLCPSK